MKTKPRKWLKPMSAKRQRESKVYARLRKEFLKAHPTCCFPLCKKPATDVHHANGRGPNYLATLTYRALCRTHHQWVGDNIEKARDLGLICPKGQWMVSVNSEIQ